MSSKFGKSFRVIGPSSPQQSGRYALGQAPVLARMGKTRPGDEIRVNLDHTTPWAPNTPDNGYPADRYSFIHARPTATNEHHVGGFFGAPQKNSTDVMHLMGADARINSAQIAERFPTDRTAVLTEIDRSDLTSVHQITLKSSESDALTWEFDLIPIEAGTKKKRVQVQYRSGAEPEWSVAKYEWHWAPTEFSNNGGNRTFVILNANTFVLKVNRPYSDTETAKNDEKLYHPPLVAKRVGNKLLVRLISDADFKALIALTKSVDEFIPVSLAASEQTEQATQLSYTPPDETSLRGTRSYASSARRLLQFDLIAQAMRLQGIDQSTIDRALTTIEIGEFLRIGDDATLQKLIADFDLVAAQQHTDQTTAPTAGGERLLSPVIHLLSHAIDSKLVDPNNIVPDLLFEANRLGMTYNDTGPDIKLYRLLVWLNSVGITDPVKRKDIIDAFDLYNTVLKTDDESEGSAGLLVNFARFILPIIEKFGADIDAEIAAEAQHSEQNYPTLLKLKQEGLVTAELRREFLDAFKLSKTSSKANVEQALTLFRAMNNTIDRDSIAEANTLEDISHAGWIHALTTAGLEDAKNLFVGALVMSGLNEEQKSEAIATLTASARVFVKLAPTAQRVIMLQLQEVGAGDKELSPATLQTIQLVTQMGLPQSTVPQ